MKVQLAHEEYLSEICELLKVLDTEKQTFSIEEVNRLFIFRGWSHVAVVDGKVVGVMVLEPTEGSYKIYTLVSRQRGAGRLMMDRAVEICRENRIPKLWCWSLARYEAEGFYDKMGFRESFLLEKQWDGEDCYFHGKLVE